MNTDIGLSGHAVVTEAIIGAAFEVSNTLGVGFLEKVYENALAVELRAGNHEVLQQHPIDVRYRNEIVGIYQADLIVDNTVVVELKSVPFLERVHRSQCLNYLRATGMHTSLLINFGRSKLEVERIVSRS